jgi:predicted ATPase/class 3 adenylate cyclase
MRTLNADNPRLLEVNAASPQTLTFLFTDIEGSTPLWDMRPDAMRAATERHNALLREAISARGGNAFRVVGDAFCVAFPDAGSALLAAIEAQRALRAQAWGDAPIHVRMGLHSGAVEAAGDEIFRGPSLARAARVMSAAHGDQVLATAATVALLEGALPAGAELRDMGDHTLRGFARPERLYQVLTPGLRADFPPIRTQQAQRTNLPASLTPFVGRARALAEVREAARRSRMLSLIGPGGTGKTRLAIEAASELVGAFEDGVWLVDLAPVANPNLMAATIATTFGARAEGDVPPLSLVETALAGKRALVILDNCEHLIEESARVAHALPRLHLLSTSREALGIEGETLYRVPSMTMPTAEKETSAVEVSASEAGALFMQRAQAVAPSFVLTDRNASAVARVCRRLDGIPLAIELAAARLTALSIDELARRVDDRFRLLSGGLRTALPRQRTLRALVDWSYDLLSADERRVFASLAVFSGGFTLAAADRICGSDQGGASVLDTVEHLVAKSLVIADQQPEAETRYRLLETIRQYAEEKLAESGGADFARERHFAFFVQLANRAAEALDGPLALEWLDRVEVDHDNIRAALDWSADVSPADHARLAAAMTGFWDTRGHFTEGFTRLERAVALHGAPDETRLRALIGAGQMAYRLDHTQRSAALLSEAIALAQALGDTRLEAQATLDLAIDSILHGPEIVESLGRRAQALAKAAGDGPREGLALFVLGRAAVLRCDYGEAQIIFLESARRWDDTGCVLRAPLARVYAGGCALEQLDFTNAHRLLDTALIEHRRMGNVHDAATTLRSLAELALNEKRLEDARMLGAESVRMFHEIHDPNCGARSATVQASVLCAIGEAKEALAHAESVVETYRRTGASKPMLAAGLRALVRVHAAVGDENATRKALVEALEAHRVLDRNRSLPGLLETAARMEQESEAAPKLLGSAKAMRERWCAAVPPAESDEHARCHAAVRAAWDAPEFERLFAAGHALDRDAAIETALALVCRSSA